MATPEQVKRAKQLIGEIRAVPIADLVSNLPRWGEINFEEAVPSLDLIYDLAGHLADLPIEFVPVPTFDSFIATLAGVSTPIEAIKDFKLGGGGAPPDQRRADLVNQLKAASEQLLVVVQGWIGFLAYQRGDVTKNLGALSTSVTTATGMLDDAKVQIQSKNNEMAEILRAAREASAGAGVATFTQDFANQATKLENEAKKWLAATGCLIALTIVLALLWTWLQPLAVDARPAQIAQFFATKFVVLGLLVTATVWCARLYRAAKHQAAVCSHRANALLTFQAFVKATEDASTRDAVLLETTRSIFAIAPSGYLEAVETSADSGSKVMDFVKSAAKPG